MVKVKICGLTRSGDVEMVCESGADMVGVIVNAKVPTPRNLDYRKARRVLEQVPSGVEKVAVGMPENLSEGLEIVNELDPDYLQLHSFPALNEVEELREATGIKLISAISIPREAMDSNAVVDCADRIADVSDYLLLDTERLARGRTGETHDWSISRRIRKSLDKPIFLAGGLNPSNVREAIKKVEPYGVDAASGVEAKPGVKDQEKVRAFVKASKMVK
ncbi:hypothetical protein AKJ43_03140 [candidate division MSBL1 archaeon SCGC-AAA261D19]|uniref:N-(5'-phosphoribosyl)anthranilate isomerase n=1 Tax=candidate division MSBL1 archaeon SCGC-AAA261D19 TaxID=1698273 RepID=A0A133V5L2_9EURY|nr:hypothetical protein AKJ43_03140 [candidate division MSBL1 archaeon SCGC-AAA261D19]